MKILITGTTGFIGKSLAEFYLERGHEVISPLRGFHLPSILDEHEPDVIINSADHGTTDKRRLWPIAFRFLGNGADYANSFLIEDGDKSPEQFMQAGGKAYQYRDDLAFADWIKSRCR